MSRKKRWIPIEQLMKRDWMKSLLIVFSVFLILGGPTLLIYVLQRFGIPQSLFTLIGLASFVIGIMLFMGLAKEEKTA